MHRIKSRHECRMETGANDGMPQLTALPKSRPPTSKYGIFSDFLAATACSPLYYGLLNIVLY
ncbi:hypothetical protein [Paenibacillus sp. W2I17]|uniref:hypothetical protein n=1 Tax=Paenibacillus sp. W2I17 TaxID=3042311 RepID=UPI002781392C|nr:hypothetical protein [Paenibacillus sp. W2I17]MDQ0661423.1 hypothetical protein [Paenibacillus sp. W2I17]